MKTMKKGFFKNNKILGINLLYILSLLPIIIFGFYKNGLLGAKNGYMSYALATQYLVVPLIIIVLSYVFEAYYFLLLKKEATNHSIFNTIIPYINALCYLVCGPSNPLWLIVLLIALNFILIKLIDSKISINQVALYKCVLVGLLTITGIGNAASSYELATETLNLKKLFLGFGIGGIGTTSILCSLIGYFILLFNKYYKKEIPIFIFLSYAIISVVMYFVGGLSFHELLVNTFNSDFIFASIFVATLTTSTPVVRSGRIIYSIIVGGLCAILINIVGFNLGIYLVILGCSLITPLLNKFKITLD